MTENVNFMQNSAHDNYRNLKSSKRAEKYLNMPIPFKQKRLMFEFRTNLNYIVYNKPWDLRGSRKYNFGNCTICNTNDTEDVYHIFYVCPHYETPRLNLFNEIGHIKENVSRENFVVKAFKILNESVIENICNFWNAAMRIRDFVSTY